jgi:hypothetical protein
MKGPYHPDGPICSNDGMKIVRELGGDTGRLEHVTVGAVLKCFVVVGGDTVCRRWSARLSICSVGPPHLSHDEI